MLLKTGLPTWFPLPGPQSEAYHSEADVLLFGGAAGGGKSDLLLGLALTAHDRAIIFRRQFKDCRTLMERTAEILNTNKGLNEQLGRWKLPLDLPDITCRLLEFGACKNPGDERNYQGRPHDFVGIDEGAHFLETQVRFLMNWCRSSRADQRTRVVITSNPPTEEDYNRGSGEWMIRYFAPWINPEYENPAQPGELRWFVRLPDEDRDREVEDGSIVNWKGEFIVPKSRTFIPSSIDDNPYLSATGYKATLQALPEPLRSQMLHGSFDLMDEGRPDQVIPTAWIVAAQERWKDRERPKVLTSIGVDPARGGRDETVITLRYGNYMAEQIIHPGSSTPDGPSVAALIFSYLRDRAYVNVDVVGIGSSVYDHLRQAGIEAYALNGSKTTDAIDRTGSIGFANCRSEWFWRMREALDPQYGDDMALPPCPQLRADLAAPRFRVKARGIEVEPKEIVTSRLSRSPDRGDSALYALAQPLTVTAKGIRFHTAETDYDELSWS